ncbi:MAG: hypothetical protein ACD_2C00137G0004 [uncultured bacterium (gcode 4)]|uniref:Uncharacterized protein n=1 Tax=uncultured bacterium (gcode 4) TaxID=1234023 RepID=K2GGR5_9BACT|nr:MAG: hypothetical protein ACD_2C00137G0004 [uncultured bacterium (gcode 4)]
MIIDKTGENPEEQESSESSGNSPLDWVMDEVTSGVSSRLDPLIEHRRKIGEIDRFIESHFGWVKNPQTEDDYMRYLLVTIFCIAWLAEHTQLDTTKIWDMLKQKVYDICKLFNVEHPANPVVPEGKMSFREWWESTCEKMGRDRPYPDYIFEKIPKEDS